MAKGKYEYWLTEDGLTLLQGWARDGLTDEQIAEKCGICRDTLYDWKKKHPDISDTLKKGKEIVDMEVENALLKKALSGDVAAIIFWVKNRMPKKWKDKPVDIETGMEQINKNILDLADVIRQTVPERKMPNE